MNKPVMPVGSKLVKQLRRAFSGLDRCRILKLRDAYRLVGDSVRVPYEGFPMELMLGDEGKRLLLYPEYPLNEAARSELTPSFIVEDPERKGPLTGGFLRLEPGEELMLGRHDAQQQALFQYPESVKERHLRLIHDDDAVVFKDKTAVGTCISPMLNEEKTHRVSNLARVHEIFGGALEPLEQEEALALINEVNLLMQQEPRREKDSRDLPGGIVELPADLTPIVVADLHAQVDNLLVILTHNGFLDALENGEACLIVIGDAVHPETEGQLEDMTDSMLMMDLIFRLKLRFPEHFYYLRGNHDSFSEAISKSGVSQGLVWKKALRKTRGKEYRKAMQSFYDLLPYVAVSPNFIAAHAGPPRNKVSRNMLINIHRYPDLAKELVNNRMQSPNRPGGYSKGDIKRFRKTVEQPDTVPFIVGHTPMDQDSTYWLEVGGCRNHHILYSADDKWVGAFTRIGSDMWPMKYPCERLRDLDIAALDVSSNARKKSA